MFGDFTDKTYVEDFSIYFLSRNKWKEYETINEIYQYMRKLYGKDHPQHQRRLKLILYHAEPPYNLIAIFADEQLPIWSTDPATQEWTRQTFQHWQEVEDYYNKTLEYCRWKPKHDRQLAEAAAEQARLKEERRLKRLSNDPDNPAARKRKSRRHLQRLGYDLHITRQHRFDGKGYQIVKLDSGEIIAGKNFDLTLYEVERFYMDADLEREKNCRWDEDVRGHLYNFEPDLERRERIAREKLEKKHYRLTRRYDKVGYKKEAYHIDKRKRVRKQDRFVEIRINGKYYLTLDDVEKFVAENC